MLKPPPPAPDGQGAADGGAECTTFRLQSSSSPPRRETAGGGLAAAALGSGAASGSGGRFWSTEGIARDPAAFLVQALEPFLSPNSAKVREQVESLVKKTLQVTEGHARAVAEGERTRTAESLQAARQEMRALQAELDATERNRAELASLLEATVASAGGMGSLDSSRRQSAAVKIQCAWRACLARRQRKDLRTVDPYDVIVCFESLSSVIDSDSLRINILKWAGTAFDICSSQLSGVRIVAHMGLFDKGKTWLINTLYGKNLPSGKLHETSGLSMVYVPEMRFLIIDTKGLQAPVSYKTKGVKQLVDASQTEVFLFELVSRIAHYIIFVVNDFTWPEQRHVVQLHQKYVISKRENQLIVVHNLRTTRSCREAQELFWKQVSSKYEGVDRGDIGSLVFTVDEKPRIHHVGFAGETSPAGLMYNQKNKAHLLQLLDQLEGIGERRRSVAGLLEENFAKLLPEFVYLENSAGVRFDGRVLQVAGQMEPPGSSDLGGRMEPDEERDPALYRAAGRLELQVPPGHRVYMKTEGVFSDFCELVAQDVTFKPLPPNVYELRLKDKLVRLIEFEIPGVLRKDIVFKKGNRGYTVNLVRAKDADLAGYGVAPKFPAPRNPVGEFSFDLFFEDGVWELDGGREAVRHDNGVLRIRLKQDSQGEVFSLDDL